MEFPGGESCNLGLAQMGRRSSIYRDPDMDHNDDELGICSSGSGSSGVSSDEEDFGEAEVESSCKGPLDTMDALEEVLPVRRGISKFYNGKSKSFTSLADAASSASVKEFAKPETAYSKKQITLLASKTSDKKHINSLRNQHGGLSKKLIPSSYGNRSSINESCSTSVSPPLHLPPLHPQSKKIQNAGSPVSPPRQKCSPWRSFSVSDLHGMVHNA